MDGKKKQKNVTSIYKENKDAKGLKRKKRKRLIIRNLSFKATEEELKKIFSEYGAVLDVNIPLMKDGRKRGFCFIEYEDMKSLIKAMKALNFKKIHGRPIAIDYAMSKAKYEATVKNIKTDNSKSDSKEEAKSDSESEQSDESEENLSDDENKEVCERSDVSLTDKSDSKVKEFFKEFDEGIEADAAESLEEENSSDSSFSDDDESSKEKEEVAPKVLNKERTAKKRKSSDVAGGKTVFIRNLSFSTAQDDLFETMEEYGDIEYCVLCMDPLTDHPKGTGFVKFKRKEDADNLILRSSMDPGIIVDGRRLLCVLAVDKKELPQKTDDKSKPKDRRNLYLLKYGLILPGSEEAKNVSPADMAKRIKLEMFKKGRIKNVNYFVSDKRLVIHNLPKNISDKELFFMFKKAAGSTAMITECRVMRDLKKLDDQGNPVSRGFGFVAFARHEDALKALEELNNNHKIFTPQKRPIVEFSVENKVALVAKERKREKMLLKNKKKLEVNKQENSDASGRKQISYKIKKTKKEDETEQVKRLKKENQKGNLAKRRKSEVSLQNEEDTQKSKRPQNGNQKRNLSKGKESESSPKKKKKRLKKRNEQDIQNNQDKESVSSLACKYREKLLNKV